ncbi:MAG: hypothetical protein A2157_15070 [Deltaproteobacteria bacterium RBG_16_47_11]|nr:MAG: hypothetical protein A2157_15070 [Deltaproteobacteria bacterium RBG_16_47_11]
MRVPIIIWVIWFLIGMWTPFVNCYAQEKTDFHSDLMKSSPSELLRLYQGTTQPAKRDAIVDTLLTKRENSIAALRNNLVVGTEEQKLVSMGLLIEMRAKESGDILINLLTDESPKVQRQAAYALGHFKYGRSYENLVQMLKPTQDQGVIKSVLAGLGMLGRRDGIPHIRPWLSHSDASVRVNAAISLAALGNEEGLSEVIKASKSQDNQTRREGTFGLGFFKESEARSRLQEIIADSKAPWKTEALIYSLIEDGSFWKNPSRPSGSSSETTNAPKQSIMQMDY